MQVRPAAGWGSEQRCCESLCLGPSAAPSATMCPSHSEALQPRTLPGTLGAVRLCRAHSHDGGGGDSRLLPLPGVVLGEQISDDFCFFGALVFSLNSCFIKSIS